MNGRLVDFLRRNQERILDDWQTEMELLPPCDVFTHGELSYEYLTELFENVLNLLNINSESPANPPGLHHYMDFTLTCSPQRSACVDLHQAGQIAFIRALNDGCGSRIEFTQNQIKTCSTILQNALAITLRREIEMCSEVSAKEFCPFKPGNESPYRFLSSTVHFINK